MFLERKILSEIYNEPYRQFSALIGFEELSTDIEEFNRQINPSPWTKLVVDLSHGKDPDDAFSRVPYEKGHTFLFYLESIVGRDSFLNYLQKYLSDFATKSINTDQWKSHLISNFPSGSFDSVDWNTWLYGFGMPPIIPNYDMTMKEGVTCLVKKYCSYIVNHLELFPPQLLFITLFPNINLLVFGKKVSSTFNFSLFIY